MIRIFFLGLMAVWFSVTPLHAQDLSAPAVPATSPASDFDTSYRPSPSTSARLQRLFLQDIRWAAGTDVRDTLAAAFARRPHTEIWQDLMAQAGLETGNVADALAAYWALNWMTANREYEAVIDYAPIQRQLRYAFSRDPSFRRLGDQQRQEMAEGYILNFLFEQAALSAALSEGDEETLAGLAEAAVARFRQNMGVDLLTLSPGPNGFRSKQDR